MESILACLVSPVRAHERWTVQSHKHVWPHDKSKINPSEEAACLTLNLLSTRVCEWVRRCVLPISRFCFQFACAVWQSFYQFYCAYYAFIIVFTAFYSIRHPTYLAFQNHPPLQSAMASPIVVVFVSVCECIFEFYCSGIVASLACSNVTFIYPEHRAPSTEHKRQEKREFTIVLMLVSMWRMHILHSMLFCCTRDARDKYVLTSIQSAHYMYVYVIVINAGSGWDGGSTLPHARHDSWQTLPLYVCVCVCGSGNTHYKIKYSKHDMLNVLEICCAVWLHVGQFSSEAYLTELCANPALPDDM